MLGRYKGLTLIELIIVILILAALSVVMMPALYQSPASASLQASRLVSQIRWVQNLAMTRHADNVYQIIFPDCSPNTPGSCYEVISTSGDSLPFGGVTQLEDAVIVSNDFSVSGISFFSTGLPVTSGALTIQPTKTSGNQLISINSEGKVEG